MADVSFIVRGADGTTLQGDPVKVAHSDKIDFFVDVTDRVAGVTYQVTLAHGAEQPLSNSDVPTTGKVHPIRSVNQAEHGGKWTAKVVGSDGATLPVKKLNLEVTAEVANPAPAPPGVYDKQFAIKVGIAIAAAFLILCVVMAAVLMGRKKSEVPVVWVLAFGLFTVGVLLAGVGAFRGTSLDCSSGGIAVEERCVFGSADGHDA